MLAFVLLSFLPACLTAAVVTATMRRLAPKVGLVDQPAARKVHVTPTPLGGGVGIVIGVVLPCIAAWTVASLLGNLDSVQPDSTASWLLEILPPDAGSFIGGIAYRGPLLASLLGAGLVLSVIGLIDDRIGLPWPPRLLVQFGVAVFLVYSGFQATVFVDAPIVGQVVSVLWIVGLINSLNFLDNMDGLSGGIGFIAASLFAFVMLSAAEPRWLVGGLLLVLAGSCFGFLLHNRPPAKIFMGDCGSTFLGMMLASLTLAGTFYAGDSTGPHVLLAPLCVLAIPLYDTFTVVAIRLSQGRSPFQPDKCHFSHRLVELGLTRAAAVLTVHLATLTTGLGALLLYRVSGWLGAAIILAMVFCLLLIVTVLESTGRRSIAAREEDVSEQASSDSETPQ